MPKILHFPGDENERAMTRMPFGRYRGELLAEIPDSYLEWAISGECRLVNENQALFESIKTRLMLGPSVRDDPDEWEDRYRRAR